MKVNSIEDLYEGRNIKIMELNGVSSDPGHIYDRTIVSGKSTVTYAGIGNEVLK